MKWYQHIGASIAALSALSCTPHYFVIQSDVNRDHYVDLVVGEKSGDVYVLLNSKEQKEDTQRDQVNVYFKGRVRSLPVKNGAYEHQTLGTLRNGLKQLGVFDINDDGLEDVIAVDNNENVFLYYNNGDGSFRMDETVIVK